jgi:pimeloyl-ACP methyl ester carboxylesterase
MARGIAGARLAILPGAAHLPSLETPEAYAEALRAFLSEAGC